MAHENRLTNRHVLIFGGTSGIGFATASMALSNAANVTISGSRQPKVDDKVTLLRSFYPSLPSDKVAGFALDLSDTVNLEKGLIDVFEKATNGGEKKVDHIVFTATGDINGKPTVETVDPATVFDGFKVRWLAPVIIAKVLATNPGKYMPVSHKSSVTVTGGTNTVKPMPGWSIAAAWGGATDGLVRGMAVDMKPIRWNQVEPGAVQTELLQGYLEMLGPDGLEKMKREGGVTGELGQPEDLAEAYGWLMRDWFVTGKTASSDGGRLLV
ncbi:NAD(P)-binding protein [Aaosphaeria arxii CBS 175.79]|uniref:NAD(P)-binding protein n=1 Tax=Aaosphaeria arxii CBS 175.79 TaxID=1450172 RepID=A0A6A5XK74_9PLEO|nr:NAD(P)-binding protein [Aaosphaeria arxii CBS 175.79]KAF2013532.1 NAD(P)-binding protein [Aaosphaeria arxii CBS 175.79]